ncbi:hypothetical protein B0T21DRAFT_345857 [Apiosordaria backusii]|uniref:DNA mismatch repair protein HSM3 N-terminal domain-containing protein n=1 Tax=Apiosordaria backusii TaxID=314023 RepID=A0AA40K124_9PEZI|nr:hypothetical protein B0T21DRAFT_345857 [Apiosordaria backusii]
MPHQTDDVPILPGLDELNGHLHELIQDPSLAIDPKLFDDVELQLTDSNIPGLIPFLLPKLTQILKQYTGDPAVVVSLTIKLLRPISFTQAIQLASEESLIQALSSSAQAAQILGLTIIHKATSSSRDISILCAMPSLVQSLITTWLSSPNVEVGQKATKVLGDLLEIDCQTPVPGPNPFIAAGETPAQWEPPIRRVPGHGGLWQLILHTSSTYNLLLDLISGRHPSTANNRSQLSLAQGRILRLLPRLAALNIDPLASSSITGPMPAHLTNGHRDRAPQPGEGLLQYAALRMVDKADPLMHRSLVDFFEAFVSLMRISGWTNSKEQIIKKVLREAVPNDDVLRGALESLPNRTVDQESEGLKRWLRAIMPRVTQVPLR